MILILIWLCTDTDPYSALPIKFEFWSSVPHFWEKYVKLSFILSNFSKITVVTGSITRPQEARKLCRYRRFQCCGSVKFWYGSGSGSGSSSGSCYCRHWPSRRQQKTTIFFLISAHRYYFEGAITSFFKGKNSQRSHKIVGIKVYLTLFAWW